MHLENLKMMTIFLYSNGHATEEVTKSQQTKDPSVTTYLCRPVSRRKAGRHERYIDRPSCAPDRNLEDHPAARIEEFCCNQRATEYHVGEVVPGQHMHMIDSKVFCRNEE